MSDGSLYPALHKLDHEGWIKAEWKVTGNGRRALKREAANWERLARAVPHVVPLSEA